MKALKVENLYKTFRTIKGKYKALDGVSFSVDSGEILGFLGPNGAGKSTTIKIMMSLIKPDIGNVLINQIDSSDKKSRNKLGFLPENPSFVENLTGMETVLFSARMHNIEKSVAKEKALKLLNQLGLSKSADKPVRTYSKGMLQRLGIITAIIHKPDIIILDEPMSGLDPVGRFLFKKIVKRLNSEGTTIFFSSHIISDIENLCSSVVIINRGKVVKVLHKSEIKAFSTSGYEIIFKCNRELNTNRLDNIADIDNFDKNLYRLTINAELLIPAIDKLKKFEIEILSIEAIKEDLESVFVKIINNKTTEQ